MEDLFGEEENGDQELGAPASRYTEEEQQAMIDDLTAICNSLGKMDENDGTYMMDRDCKSCLKEIIRMLNADADHVVRITLGSLNIVKSDLIPLITQYCDYNDGDQDLFNLILRVATNITSSILLLFENQESPTTPEQMKVYNKLMRGLHGYKEAFANDTHVWQILNTHLRHTEDEIPFERLIILIRNILHIPVDTAGEFGLHNSFDTQALCLYKMDQSNMFDTIIQIASESQRGIDFCFHIIEIVYLMLRDQNPTTVALSKSSVNKRKLSEEDDDRKRLLELSARDKRDHHMSTKKFVAPRFKNSSFLYQNSGSLSNRGLVCRSLPRKGEVMNFDQAKTELRKSKNKKPMCSETSSAVLSDRNTKQSRITYSLKIFSRQFVEKVYSNYMQQIKHNLIQKKAADNDESYYLWAIQYFTAFNRLLYLNMDNVSETMSTSTLHFIQILITNYQDKIKIEKKRTNIEKISKRLHLAVRAYREILLLIKSIQQESDFWKTCETIRAKIFTEIEYNSLMLTLFQQFEEAKHCPEYLKDLIITNDIFLDMFEHYSKTHSPVEVEEEDEENEIENEEERGNDEKNDVLESEKDKKDEDVENEGNEQKKDDDVDADDECEGDKNSLDEFVLKEQDNDVPVGKTKRKKARKRRSKSKKEFRSTHFMARYCCPEIVRAYLNVLKDFKTNSQETNLNILKFYERVVYDCKSETMLLQASVFNCLLDIINYHPSMPGYEGFLKLSKHLMTTFSDYISKKRWMIQELLFWKTTNDIIELENAVDPPPPPVPVLVESPTRHVSPDGDEFRLNLDDDDVPPADEKSPSQDIDSLEDLLASDSSQFDDDDGGIEEFSALSDLEDAPNIDNSDVNIGAQVVDMPDVVPVGGSDEANCNLVNDDE